MTGDSPPQTREQYSAHLPALHPLSNLGWRFLTTGQCLALRGGNREVLLKQRLIEVLQTRRFEYKGERYPLSPSAIDQIVRECDGFTVTWQPFASADQRFFRASMSAGNQFCILAGVIGSGLLSRRV